MILKLYNRNKEDAVLNKNHEKMAIICPFSKTFQDRFLAYEKSYVSLIILKFNSLTSL